VLALSGGLLLEVRDDVVGAVRVFRSPGKDDDCFQAGIDKVAAFASEAISIIAVGPWCARRGRLGPGAARATYGRRSAMAEKRNPAGGAGLLARRPKGRGGGDGRLLAS
jgi:hypothetical protein